MRLTNVLQVGFSITLFGGSLLWAYTDKGWEACIAAIGTLAGLIYVIQKIKSNTEEIVTPISSINNENSNNTGTILSGFINHGQVIVNPSSKKSPITEEIKQELTTLWQEFLNAENEAEIKRIYIQLQTLNIIEYDYKAYLLNEKILQAIRYYQEKALCIMIMVAMLAEVCLYMMYLLKYLGF